MQYPSKMRKCMLADEKSGPHCRPINFCKFCSHLHSFLLIATLYTQECYYYVLKAVEFNDKRTIIFYL